MLSNLRSIEASEFGQNKENIKFKRTSTCSNDEIKT